MILFVNIIGIFLILFIILWFWIIKPKSVKKISASESIDVVVENGVYNPALIKIKSGEKIKLRFIRKDPSPCAEWVVFQKLDQSFELPVNKPHIIELKIDQPGTYEFTCQMNMYRGKLVVE
jgi:plastocyanin domain-containing protein